MFGDWLLKMAAYAAGFSPKQLALIEKSLPATHKFIALIVKAQPLIEKAIPIANEAMPVIKEALPLVNELAVELQKIGPALEIILDVIEKHTEVGKSQADAINAIHNALARFSAPR